MAVDSFDPASMRPVLSPGIVETFLALADHLDEPAFAMTPDTVSRLAAYCRQGAKQGGVDWSDVAAACSDAQLQSLIRVFTRGERELPEWQAGAKSPVIVFVRVLKARGAYSPQITAWIKANSENRFLPHGSLMDRLG